MFHLAHLSDVHLGPMPSATFGELCGKRITGHQSWHRNRHAIHSRKVADLLRQHIRDAKPDHIAITGDMVNIALAEEFTNALSWLQEFGAPDWISLVPGNHDAYVPMPHNKGLGLWQEYMTGNVKLTGTNPENATDFPYIRTFGDIALIGVRTGIPTLPFLAGGKIGPTQLNALEHILEDLGRQQKCRVIMIHHPPLPGQNAWRKALWDASELTEVLKRQGAELVLHGHNHVHMFATTPGPENPIPVYGVPAASMRTGQSKPEAHYYVFSMERLAGSWQIKGTSYGLTPDETGFEARGSLPSP